MDEPHFMGAGELSVARFGLSDSVGEAVRDYYDLLFDNVQEYIGMNRDELRGYEAENAELREKLKNDSIIGDERQVLVESLEKNQEQILRLQEFMNTSRILETGIQFSGEILDDSEPELTDRFNEAPVAEKYTYLMMRYMDEYRQEVLKSQIEQSHEMCVMASTVVDEHRRDIPSAWDNFSSLGNAGKRWAERLDVLEQIAVGSRKDWQELRAYADTESLVAIDSFRYGAEKVREFFPELARQYEKHKQVEYAELLKSDPVRLQSDLMTKYAADYVANVRPVFLEVQHACDALQSRLREHDAVKPGWMKNLVTLGNAGKTWKSERVVLTQKIISCEKQVTELQRLREECGAGWLSETARKYAKGDIEERHPEVVEACERHMAQHWQQKNEERLEKQEARQAERGSGAEKMLDNGSSRHM